MSREISGDLMSQTIILNPKGRISAKGEPVSPRDRWQSVCLQARAVGCLVSEYLPNLPFDRDQLRMLPKKLFEKAAPLFVSQSRAPAP
jgi:hypothetical protein